MSSTHGSDALRKFRFAAGGEGNAEEGGARRFIKLAQKAEELGYDSFMIPDHLGNQVGPIAALGALAVATDKIRLGTAVLANGFRHPAVLAKDAATIDVLSGGRLELGIGAGWMKEEFDKGGIAYESPGVRIEKLRGVSADSRHTAARAGMHFRRQALSGAWPQGQPATAAGPAAADHRRWRRTEDARSRREVRGHHLGRHTDQP